MTLQVVKVPDIGEGITQVELVAWHVKLGDTVAEDQALADVMTDKATVEIPSPVAGQVVQLGGEVGQVLPVGSELIRIERGGLAAQAPGAALTHGPSPASGRGEPTLPAAASTSGPSAAFTPGRSAALSPGPSPGSGRGEPTLPAAASTSGSSAAFIPGRSAALTSGPSPASGRGGELHPRGEELHPMAASSRSHGPGVRAADGSGEPARQAAEARTASAPLSRSAGEGSGVRVSAPVAGYGRPIASPAVRARSWELGVDLREVPPSGPGGRITREDLEAYATRRSAMKAPAPAAARPGTRAAGGGTRDVKIIGLRRIIAQRMQESKRRIPHYTYVEEVDVTELEMLRAQLNTKWATLRGHLTMLPFLVRAIVQALREYPQINGRFDDQAGVMTEYDAVHVGIATQTDAGLMVPVLRDAQTHDLWSCAAEIARLARASREGTAVRDELTGSTITITSLGKLGGIVSTPVINHPEVAIVGVNRVALRPMIVNGSVAVRQMMNLSSSFDHRVVDGAQAAGFVQDVRGLLERPATLFID